jgi:hypothetical protein
MSTEDPSRFSQRVSKSLSMPFSRFYLSNKNEKISPQRQLTRMPETLPRTHAYAPLREVPGPRPTTDNRAACPLEYTDHACTESRERDSLHAYHPEFPSRARLLSEKKNLQRVCALCTLTDCVCVCVWMPRHQRIHVMTPHVCSTWTSRAVLTRASLQLCRLRNRRGAAMAMARSLSASLILGAVHCPTLWSQ